MVKLNSAVLSAGKGHWLEYIECLFARLALEARLAGTDATLTDGSASSNDGALAERDPAVFYGAGHGRCCVWTCECGEPYLEVRGECVDEEPYECLEERRLERMVGRHVHLLSCYTARLLGPELVKRGVRSYIGYSSETIMAVAADEPPAPCAQPDPLRDFFTFIDSDCEGERAIMTRGASVAEAVEAMKARFTEYIERYEVGEWKDWPIAYDAALLLRANRDSLVALGDLTWRPCPWAVPVWPMIAAAGASIPLVAVLSVVGAEEVRKGVPW